MNVCGTKKHITKRKTPFYSTLKNLLNERIFKMTYFSGHVHFNVKQPNACWNLFCSAVADIFQLKVLTCTIKKKADFFFVTVVFIYLLLLFHIIYWGVGRNCTCGKIYICNTQHWSVLKWEYASCTKWKIRMGNSCSFSIRLSLHNHLSTI